MKRFFFVCPRFTSELAFVFFLFFVFGGVTGNSDDDSIIIRRFWVGFLNLPTGFLSVDDDSIINFRFLVPPRIIYFVYKKNE